MKAAVLGETGVEVRDIPKPEPKPNEVLIRVRASTLNRADLIVASGHWHGGRGGPGTAIGLECAGEVEAVGARGRGHPRGRSRHGDDGGRDRRICGDGFWPGAPHSRQQHDLRAGGVLPGRARHHA